MTNRSPTKRDVEAEKLAKEWAETKRIFWEAVEPPLRRFTRWLNRLLTR